MNSITASTIARNERRIWWLVLAVAAVKFCLLPFFQNTDSDAVTRIYMSVDWMDHPHWIMSGIWAPFHFYLNAFFLLLWNSPEYGPSAGNIILSALTLVPVYHFTRRIFSREGAWAVAIFLAVAPVLFRISFMGLSETPYLFFLALSLERISAGLSNRRITNYILAGIFITIAGGFRYEAWIVSGLLCLVILLQAGFRSAFAFGIAALLFPVLWMIQSHIDTGNAFYSFQGNTEWTMNVMENNRDMDLESYLRRTWFFPFVWMISAGPVNAFLILKNIISSVRQRIWKLASWAIPFVAVMLFFEINAFKGILLLQTRFIGTLVLLSLPLVAPSFCSAERSKTRLLIISAFLTITLSFIYNINDVSPLPRLKDQSYSDAANVIRANAVATDALIIDFCGWENSYYMALHSGVENRNIVMFYLSAASPLPKDRITKAFINRLSGIVVIRRGSLFEKELEITGNTIRFNDFVNPAKKIFENEKIEVYKWSR